MIHDPIDEPQPLKAPRQFRLWHLLALVAGLAPFFVLARRPDSLYWLFFFVLVLGPAIIAAIYWDHRISKPPQKNQAPIDAFAEFCQFLGLCGLVILYWVLLFVSLCVLAFIFRDY